VNKKEAIKATFLSMMILSTVSCKKASQIGTSQKIKHVFVKSQTNHLIGNDIIDQEGRAFNDRFQKALDFVISIEGGYSNNVHDKGGKTNYGITQATYNNWLGEKKDVSKITKVEAAQIYYDNYWIASGAASYADIRLAIVMFDMAVNHGPANAKKIAKRAKYKIAAIFEERRNFYRKIVVYDKTQKLFLRGWLSRVNLLEQYVMEVAI